MRRARSVLDANAINGEVIVADNNSDEDSARLAAGAGAIVVHEPGPVRERFSLAGFAVARGRYIVMANTDLTYDLEGIPPLRCGS